MAPQDWWIRARIRTTRPVRSGRHRFDEGHEAEAIQFGFADWPIEHDAWWLTTPEFALDRGNDLEHLPCLDVDAVQVIAVLSAHGIDIPAALR